MIIMLFVLYTLYLRLQIFLQHGRAAGSVDADGKGLSGFSSQDTNVCKCRPIDTTTSQSERCAKRAPEPRQSYDYQPGTRINNLIDHKNKVERSLEL